LCRQASIDGDFVKAVATMQPEQADSFLTQASARQCNAYAVLLGVGCAWRQSVRMDKHHTRTRAEEGEEEEAHRKKKPKRSRAPNTDGARKKRQQGPPQDVAAPAGGPTPAAVSPCVRRYRLAR
jgi:hypothetical protein